MAAVESGAQRLGRWVSPLAGVAGIAGATLASIGAYIEYGNHFLGAENEQIIFDTTKSLLQPVVTLFDSEAHAVESIDGSGMLVTGEILLAGAVALLLIGLGLSRVKPKPSAPYDFDHFEDAEPARS